MMADIGFVIEQEVVVAVGHRARAAGGAGPRRPEAGQATHLVLPRPGRWIGDERPYLFGANMEFPGLPLHHSTHAEQFLVTNAAVNSEIRIRCIAVSLASTTAASSSRSSGGRRRSRSSSPPIAPHPPSPLSSLPCPSGPPDLLHKAHPLFLEPHDNKIALLEDDKEAEAADGVGICNGIGRDLVEWLRAAVAVGVSHAPYSKCPARFAVADPKGAGEWQAYPLRSMRWIIQSSICMHRSQSRRMDALIIRLLG